MAIVRLAAGSFFSEWIDSICVAYEIRLGTLCSLQWHKNSLSSITHTDILYHTIAINIIVNQEIYNDIMDIRNKNVLWLKQVKLITPHIKVNSILGQT